MKEENLYEELSNERKKLQVDGELPEWFTTGGWQLFKEKVKYDSVGYKGQIKRIAKDLAKHAPSFIEKDHPLYKKITKNYGKNWEECFFQIMWQGHLAPSSPLIANGGTDRGCTVSCSGSVIGDDVGQFYNRQEEGALLTKEGFGTSSYLGDIRPRGTPISSGGFASGSINVLNDFVQMSSDITQGAVRRGAWAGYLPIDHGDFDEWADKVHKNHAGMNIGWVITDKVIQAWKDGDEEMIRRYKKALWIKMQTGKGYFWKVDHVNRQQPQMYKDLGLSNKASNLCLVGETKITIRTTEYGVEKSTLKELCEIDKYDNIGVEIWSFNIETQLGEWKLVTDKAMTNPKAKLMKITDEETGKFIKCTPEHKIYTKNKGYVMAKDLIETDELVIG